MWGLNTDPTTDASYASLDFAWYFEGGGGLRIYENGGDLGSFGTHTTSTVCYITYDGLNIRYWKDGVVQRTVARSIGSALYFDSSFYATNSQGITSVAFGPMGETGSAGSAGATGGTGAVGATGGTGGTGGVGATGGTGGVGATGATGGTGGTGGVGATGGTGGTGGTGAIGSIGSRGSTGSTGATGGTGGVGATGGTGGTGGVGATGGTGGTGGTGAIGSIGSRGSTGSTGATGGTGGVGATGGTGGTGSAAISNNVDNYILSATASATINGEANLTFDGNNLYINGAVVQDSATQSISGTAALTIDVQSSNLHVISVAAGTVSSSITYNNRSSNPRVNTLILVFKYSGSHTITWTNVLWANSVTPTVTGVSGYADVYMLTSYQGTTGVWIGTVVAQALVSTSL